MVVHAVTTQILTASAKRCQSGAEVRVNSPLLQGEGLCFQWHKDGQEVQGETARTACLVIRNPEVHHCGFYHVTVSNDAGTVQSARACVIVQPEAVQQPHGRLMSSHADPHAGRGGRAAARRRRMLDGAAARSSNRADSLTAQDGVNAASAAGTSVTAAPVSLLTSDLPPELGPN